MYEDQTYEVILKRILARVSENFDKREGSIIFDASAPASVELAIMYAALDFILNETFADTALREHLLRRAAEYGIYPKPAGYAVLRAECTGEDVPVGSRFSLENEELNYVVLEHMTELDDGDIKSYKVQCESIGVIGNRYFGNLLPVSYINGLTSATLAELLIPGEDEEETEKFRARYLASFHSQAFGGNRKDYIERAC